MNKWRARLLGFTGLYVLFSIWAPLLWFFVSVRKAYGIESFEVWRMHWFGILTFFLLAVATLLAQFGFVVIAKEHGETEHQRTSN